MKVDGLLIFYINLNDKAIQIHTTLSDSDSMMYSILKNAILESYNLTGENYHLNFIHSQRKPFENFKDYSNQIE